MWLKMLCLVFLSSVLLSGPSCLSQGEPAAIASCKAGNLNEESPETAEKVSAFVTKLQSAVKKGDKGEVAKMISYPLLVSMETKREKVRSETEFVGQYKRIFPSPLKALLLKQKPECVSRVGAQGFTISRGEIWFNVFPSGEIKVFTITPVVMPDE